MRRKRITLILFFLLVSLLVVGAGLWLRAQQRQYALNRQLIAALVHGDDHQALALVNEGADPNTRYTPTLVPTLPEMARHLFHRLSFPTNDSPTALLLACGALWGEDDELIISDPAQLVQTMLRHGANVNAQYGDDYRTPLLCAVHEPRPNTVGVLLEHGADVNAKDSDGDTALYFIVDAQPFDDQMKVIIRQLLEHGANPNLSNNQGDTPLRAAQRAERPDLVALLKRYGARK